MALDLSDIKPTPAPPPTSLPYASADPETDMRRMFAGMRMEPTGGGKPTRTKSGERMIRTTLDLPYSMLASLEATAGSDDIGNLSGSPWPRPGTATGTTRSASDPIAMRPTMSDARRWVCRP